jgi:hypothetical protein
MFKIFGNYSFSSTVENTRHSLNFLGTHPCKPVWYLEPKSAISCWSMIFLLWHIHVPAICVCSPASFGSLGMTVCRWIPACMIYQSMAYFEGLLPRWFAHHLKGEIWIIIGLIVKFLVYHKYINLYSRISLNSQFSIPVPWVVLSVLPRNEVRNAPH